FMSSPTAAITVTAALALVSFAVIHVSGLKDHGAGGYLKTFIPHVHLEGGAALRIMGKLIVIGMAVLEYVTAFIRASVLAVRLFAADTVGPGIGMGLAIVGIGIGIGLVGYSALSGIARQPEQAGAIQGAMYVLAGLVEGAGIIAVVLCLVLGLM